MNSQGMPATEWGVAQEQAVSHLEQVLQDSAVGATVVLTDHIQGEWDRMCVFSEGTTGDRINQVLGFSWMKEKQRVFNRQYVVFAGDQKVVMHFPLALELFYGYLNTKDDVPCILAAEAHFVVDAGVSGRKFFVHKD